jgi:tetratricopeptide (TPR) repeat protein
MPLLVDPGALEAVLKGLNLYGKSNTIEQLKHAISYFKHAIKIDSTYADAYAHLSAAYAAYPYYCENTPMEALRLSEAPNNKALELNPGLPMAYLNKFNSLYFVEWKWNEALEILSKAQSLAQNDPVVLRYFVYYYVLSRKFSEAFGAIEKIRQISPNESIYWTGKIFVQFHSRDLDGALLTAEEGLKLFPMNYSLRSLKMWSLSLTGKHREAVEVARNILTYESELNPINRGEIGCVFARAGLKDEALQQLQIIQNLELNYIDPVSLGLLYMGLGDNDQAMDYFEKGYEMHSGWMPFLKRAPPFDSMRGDKRFEKLIQDLKFP